MKNTSLAAGKPFKINNNKTEHTLLLNISITVHMPVNREI